MRYFLLNKPAGCITARRDFLGRATVYDHVPPHFPRLPHVGRLDYASEGLLLFTDDGRLAQALLNGRYCGLAEPGSVPATVKTYHVKLRDRMQPDDGRLAALREPMWLHPERITTRPAELCWLGLRKRATWISLRIDEGKHRQIRRLCERSRLQVLKLRRVALGPLRLGELKLRWARPLSEVEVRACYAAALPADPLPPVEAIEDSAAAYLAAGGVPFGGS